MSLLDKGREYVTVYPEVTFTDSDGNLITSASATGFCTRATIQNAAASGTAGRRSEQDNEGFETEQSMRIRFPRSFTCKYGYLGAQAKIGWRGQMWSITGDHNYYNGSNQTSHQDYIMRRS